MVDQEVFSLLSRLWLSEPDELTLAQARTLLGLEDESLRIDELAAAYADLFLLNVYPYASIFLDPQGEMNGARAEQALQLYQRYDYQPEGLYQAGAADHIGLLLGLLAHVAQADIPAVVDEALIDFAPALCLAVERQPGALHFYQALARRTRQELFAALQGEGAAGEDRPASQPAPAEEWIELPVVEESEERTLSQIVHSLLCPNRSGIFLSRNRLGQWARQLGVPLAFGERHHLCLSLFEAAGMVERISELLDWLELEVDAWEASYTGWAAEFPAWERCAAEWRQRTASARRFLEESRESLRAAAI